MSARLVLELLMQTEMLGGLHFNFPADLLLLLLLLLGRMSRVLAMLV